MELSSEAPRKKGVHLNPCPPGGQSSPPGQVWLSVWPGACLPSRQKTPEQWFLFIFLFPLFWSRTCLSKQDLISWVKPNQINLKQAVLAPGRAGAAPLPGTTMESWCSQMRGASATLPSVSACPPPPPRKLTPGAFPWGGSPCSLSTAQNACP